MYYHKESGAIELCVEELCAIGRKGGHLDARRPRKSSSFYNKIANGARKTSAPFPNHQEKTLLSNTALYEGISYTVEGWIDEIGEKDGKVWVGLVRPARSVTSELLDRLRCFGFFVCEQRGLSHIAMRLNTVDPESGEVRYSETLADARELAAFYRSLLARVAPFANLEIERCEQRLPCVESLKFPYPNPREGQIELAESCFRAIRKGQRLFAEAPTGIGKTISTLYPAVKSLGMGICDRIFYLTSKASVRREAYAAAGKIFEAGGKLRTVVLHAKEQMCLCEGGCRMGNLSRCNPEHCPFARGYYDRVDAALLEVLAAGNGYPRTTVLNAARKHNVCPYELSLDLSEFCEIIICDYNYAFDPGVYLRRYFSPDGERGDYVFLVDEAHNLPDRARDMYSTRLSSKPFEEVYARIDPDVEPDLETTLGAFLIGMHRLERLCTENRHKSESGMQSGYYINRAPLQDFLELVTLTAKRLDAFLKVHTTHPLSQELTGLSSLLREYAALSDYYDDHFLTYVELIEGKISVEIFCLDPSGVLDACMGRAISCILFSATFTPLDYFSDILGGGKDAVRLQLSSPYDPDRLCVTVATGADTRFEEREKSYKRIATLIAATVSAKAGNYMVYFPSYDYMEKVVAQFAARYPAIPRMVQQRGMRPFEQAEFFDFFKEDRGHLRIGFCILGGSFSEGVDLPGDRLIGVIVVGVGIPGLSNERNILRDYYENKCERGYDYAYTFPGMNRVLQAAGRVIRREEDCGVVVLIDNRYAEEPYLHLYPAHWENITVAGNPTSLAKRMQDFWKKF